MGTYGAKVRAIAERQGGRLHYRQLIWAGLSPRSVANWTKRGIITRTRPQVYALGYVRTDLVALIWEAILYAGPRASLTGASGSHRCELIRDLPRSIIVATPRRCASLPGIVVHQGRAHGRIIVQGIPVAPVPELMITLAAGGDFDQVRFALGNLEFRRQLDIEALLAHCTRGRAGSALLRQALAQRLPQLARTRSPLEIAFLILLEAHHLPLPRVNVWVHGVLVDAYWPELGLVVELDGTGNHETAAQKRRDANSMNTLKRHGLTVARFDWWDVRTRQAVTLARLNELGLTRTIKL